MTAATGFVTTMAASERILGVEGGGTKTAWVLVERAADGLRVVDQGKLPSSNSRLTSPDRLRSIFRQLPAEVDRVGMFLAGEWYALTAKPGTWEQTPTGVLDVTRSRVRVVV